MLNIVFLPGASGSTEFWQPLKRYLACLNSQVIAYPGFGDCALDPNLQSFKDLENYVNEQIISSSVIVAQSMGGIFAVSKALNSPNLVEALVLIATSGGIDLSPFSVQDWREEYQNYYPNYPAWFMQTTVNYEAQLSQLNVPVLLIWGDADQISPVAVGRYLNQKIKYSELHIIKNGQHHLANEHAKQVAQLIREFLKKKL